MSAVFAYAALALGLATYLELLVRLRAAEPAGPWWFGYARDGANLAATLMLWGAYLSIGFRAPGALLAGALTTLVTYLLDWAIARALHVRYARPVLALPLCAWLVFVALRRDAAVALFEGLLSLGRPS